MKSEIVIIDYGMGNIGSVIKKIKRIGSEPLLARNSNDVLSASKLILPGVGHFASAVNKLRKMDLWEALNEAVLIKKTPILGICLGMQLMAKHSEEGNAEGFGWIDAEVVKFRVKDTLKNKVPHMGWNNAELNKESKLFQDVQKDAQFYFVHSYHFKCKNQDDILTTTEYEYSFTSSVQKDNIYGTQFHPEKSHDWGEIVLRNFVNL